MNFTERGSDPLVRYSSRALLCILLVSVACARRVSIATPSCASNPDSYSGMVRTVLSDFSWNSVLPEGDSLELAREVRVAPHLIPVPVDSMPVAMLITGRMLAEWHVSGPILLSAEHEQSRGIAAVSIVESSGSATGFCYALLSIGTAMVPAHPGVPFDRYFQIELARKDGEYGIHRVIELEM